MKIPDYIRSAFLLLLAAGLSGCEIGGDGGSNNSPNPLLDTAAAAGADAPAAEAPAAAAPAAAPAPAVPAAPSSLDELDISNATALGPHAAVRAQDARITRLLYKADKEGDLVQLAYDNLRWPVRSGAKPINARVYIYWVEGGRVIGGHFDWLGVGQSAKTLGNISAGYLGRRPARGAAIWFTLVSLEGEQRTNVKRSSTNW